MFEEMRTPGTPMFVVKAYLPVNESFGKIWPHHHKHAQSSLGLERIYVDRKEENV